MLHNADVSQVQGPLRVAGLDGEPLSLAVRTRRRAVRSLVDLLAEVRYPGVIAGSWAHADFHLLASGESLSDLDLAWLGSSETERRRMTDRISGAGWTGKISIHPAHSFEQLSLDVQKIFIIGEHLINVRLHPGPLGHDLSLAKTALLLARQSIDERYASVAERRRGVYRDALSVKLGDRVVRGSRRSSHRYRWVSGWRPSSFRVVRVGGRTGCVRRVQEATRQHRGQLKLALFAGASQACVRQWHPEK